MVDDSAILSTNAEFHRDRLVVEAQQLADERECQIDVWLRNDDGEQSSHFGITVQPQAN